MPETKEIQGSVTVVNDNIQYTGSLQVNGGSVGTGFCIADPTDSTKKMIFDLSGLSTGTTDTFTPSPGGAEVTVDGTQNLTNKGLDDTTTTFFDTAGPTKKCRFELSGVTAGQTRVLTVPDSNGTIAYLAGSTFTTATLTNPTVNAGAGTIVLPGANPPAQTAEGSAVWDTANDLLTVGTGSTRKTMMDLDSNQTASGKTFTAPVLNSPTINRTGQGYCLSAGALGKVGTTSGWVVRAADNIAVATVAAGQTDSTLVLPVTGIKVGWVITGFYLVGQLDSAGNTVTLQGELRKMTATAAGVTDATVEAGPLLSVTADTAVGLANTTLTLSSPQTVSGATSFYLLITSTTAASTTTTLQGAVVIVTEN